MVMNFLLLGGCKPQFDKTTFNQLKYRGVRPVRSTDGTVNLVIRPIAVAGLSTISPSGVLSELTVRSELRLHVSRSICT